MSDSLHFDKSIPRIKIIKAPLAGENMPRWFLEELIGLILPVEALVQVGKDLRGEKLFSFKTNKKKVYLALARKSPKAAKFLKDSPIFQEEYLFINEEAAEFIGSWQKLKRETTLAQN